MVFDFGLLARYRSGANVSVAVGAQLNEQRDLFVAQGLPPYAENTRRGRRWKVATATPFAAVVGLPTTLAKLEIKNQHATRSLVVDTIWSWQLLGTAVVWAHTPWAQVGAAVVAADTALVVHSGNGDTSYASASSTDLRTAVDQTVVAAGWETFPGSSSNFGLGAATPGGAVVGQVDGRLVVPPGKSLHVCVSGSVNTASAFHCGASGYLADITNE